MAKRKQVLNKIISILLIQTFLLSNVAFAAPQESPTKVINQDEIIQNPEKIVIPREFGLVKSKYIGKNGKLVVHIQDAHCNYEAQSNIVHILENLIKNYNVSFVSVEGADGIIDTSWFKAFPDEEVRKEVATYFMKKGEITGPEFLSITTDLPIKLFGAETRSHYIENLNAFTSSYPLKEETEKYYTQIKTVLNRLKNYIYTEELKALDSKIQDYESKKLPFNEYVRFLEGLAEKHRINLREYSDFFKLISALIYEKKIDFNVTDKERSALIDELSKSMPKEGLTELVTKSLSFKSGKISSAEYYEYLKSLALKNGIELSKKYPNLSNYIVYNSVYSKIDNEKLFNDIKNLELAIKERLFKNDDQRTLDKLSRHAEILLGLVNIKLLNGDFEYYKIHKEEFTHESFASFLKKKTVQFGLAYEVDLPSDAVQNSIPRLEDFYSIAIKRDKSLVDNTLNEIKKEKLQAAVLITGGFHSEGITKLLERQGISYLVVSPNITKDVPSPYIQILTNQRTPFEELLVGSGEAKQGMLAPLSLGYAVSLSKKELRKLSQEIRNIGFPVEDVVIKVKEGWLALHLAGWLDRTVKYAKENKIPTPDMEGMREVYKVALASGISKVRVKGAPLSESQKNEFIDKIISDEKKFKKTFDEVYRAKLPTAERPLGNLIGKIIAEDGCIVKKIIGKLSEGKSILTLSDEKGKVLVNLDVIGNVPKSAVDKNIRSIKESVKNPAHPLTDADREIADKIIQFLELKAKEGRIYLLKENTEHIFGFSDGANIFISDFLIENPIAFFHDAGEGYFASNQDLYDELVNKDMNPHTFLRGLGYTRRKVEGAKPYGITGVEKKLVELRDGLGLQDIMFGEDANNRFSRLITLSEEAADLIEKQQDLYVAIVGKGDREKGYRLSLERLGSARRISSIITDSELSNEEQNVVAKVMAFGKGSIFRFWEKLGSTRKRKLIEQIKMLDIEETERHYQKFIVRGEEGAKVTVTEDNLDMPVAYDIREGDNPENLNALKIGEHAYKAGKVAILELAGGSGARLGYDHPKIMFKISQVMNESFARMRAERIRTLAEEYGEPIPWIVMTSDVTDEETINFFNEHIIDGKYFGQVPKEWVRFERQRVLPQVTGTGEFVLEDKDKVSVGGFGHGDARDYVLRKAEVIGWLKKFGIEYVVMVNVDNPFLVGPRALGYHIQSKEDIVPGMEHVSMIVVEKTDPTEKVGLAVLLDGKDGIIEYNQIPGHLVYLPYIYKIGNEKFLLYQDKNSYFIKSVSEFIDLLHEKGLSTSEEIEKWVKDHCLAIQQIPNDTKFRWLGKDYTKETLNQFATLWLSQGNINTLIWSLSSFTDNKHPLEMLPVVVAKNKAAAGYHPETGEFSSKETGILRTHKFECMAFHGFLVGEAKGAHILIDRAGRGKEGGFAPTKDKRGAGIDTPERTVNLLSEYDASLLRELDWYVSPDAYVELSPAFSFLDGRYLQHKLGPNGVVGKGSQIYLSGTNVKIGNGLNIANGKQFILRVNDEYSPNTKVRIGDNIEVKESVSFVINGSGQLIIDNGIIFDKREDFVIDNGHLLHIKEPFTPREREDKIRTYAQRIYEERKKNSIPGSDEGDWIKAGEQVNREFPRIVRSATPDAGASGAIRLKGGDLSREDHRGERGVNETAGELIRQGRAYAIWKKGYELEGDIQLEEKEPSVLSVFQESNLAKLKDKLKEMRGVGLKFNFVIIQGLKEALRKNKIATDLIFHPGMRRQSIYLDEKEDFLYLLSLENGVDLIIEALDHEIAHINAPNMSEEKIEKIAPTQNVRRALLNNPANVNVMLETAKQEIEAYLTKQHDARNISDEIYKKAMAATYKNLQFWVNDPDIQSISPNTKIAILEAISKGRWKDIVEVFRQDITFGTAGIRGMAALTPEELDRLAKEGAVAAILKGPNTINDIVLLLKTAGVIKYAKEHNLHKVAIGYDSRIAGKQFAEMIAQSFIGQSTEEYPFTVYLFDAASPFPELSFGLTTKAVRADLGILISASHNPSNYNGYKITDFTGAQLTGKMRDAIVESIKSVTPKDIRLKPLKDARTGELIWLGGERPIAGKDYEDVDLSKYFIDMHTLHVEQVKKFIIDKETVKKFASKVKVGYAAFNGSGNLAVPRLLKELGFTDTKVISSLQELNGLYPAFGWGEQPDPGDPISADIAVREFIKEYSQKAFDELDILIGTDPDADRTGLLIKVPEAQQKFFGKYKLLSANDAWTLLLWYRLQRTKDLNNGILPDADKKYITYSHVTTDALEQVGNLFGVKSLGEMINKKEQEAGDYLNGRRSWVGFSYIADFCRRAREKGLINVGGWEESNGFSILGGPVREGEILADDGHVNDKDGTFAAMLLAEVAAYAKSKGTTLFELLDNIYLNPEVGYFATANKPMPRVGSFAGAEGVTEKINLLKKVQEWMKEANARAGTDRPFVLAGLPVIGAIEFKTGKYDEQHYDGFPDEGIRLFFADPDLKAGEPFQNSRNYITIRPSGTSQAIRFYTQLFASGLNKENLGALKNETAGRAEVLALQAQIELLNAAGYSEDVPNVTKQLSATGHNEDVKATVFSNLIQDFIDIIENRELTAGLNKIQSNLSSMSLEEVRGAIREIEQRYGRILSDGSYVVEIIKMILTPLPSGYSYEKFEWVPYLVGLEIREIKNKTFLHRKHPGTGEWGPYSGGLPAELSPDKVEETKAIVIEVQGGLYSKYQYRAQDITHLLLAAVGNLNEGEIEAAIANIEAAQKSLQILEKQYPIHNDSEKLAQAIAVLSSGSRTLPVSVEVPSFDKLKELSEEIGLENIIKTMATQTGQWATDQFKDGDKTMLGWMSLYSWMEKYMPQIRKFADEVRDGKTTDIVFVGQGGSIECIKTIYGIFGKDESSPNIHIVDTVDQEFITNLIKTLPLGTTRFVIITKSMTTMEVHSFYKLFYDLYTKRNISNPQNRFTLITDEGKAYFENRVLNVIDKVREKFRSEVLQRGFYNVFYIEPASGGRYSWDTAVGILPAFIMLGLTNAEGFREGARAVEEIAKNPNLEENPPALYGLFKYKMNLQGRNRPTLLLPPELKPYGPWAGQLDTESLGKRLDKSSLTIDHETPAEDLNEYTSKRFFVRIKLGENDRRSDARVAALERAGVPIITITLPNSQQGKVDIRDFGALLKLSEFATSITAYPMGINPVNQPGVEEYKKAQETYIKTPYIPNPNYVVEKGNIRLDYKASIEGIDKITEQGLNKILERLGRNDIAARYAAILYLAAKEKARDYAVMMAFKKLALNPRLEEVLNEWRYGVRSLLRIDTLSEEAPGILHAKQQGFQQGENTGFFTVVRFKEYNGERIVIPGSEEKYGEEKTFQDLIKAQAIGTLEALSNATATTPSGEKAPANRLGAMIELENETPATMAEFASFIEEALGILGRLVKHELPDEVSELEKEEIEEGARGRYTRPEGKKIEASQEQYEEYIYEKYVKADAEGLRKTVFSLAMPTTEVKEDIYVILAYHTGLDPEGKTPEAVQKCMKDMKRYLGDSLIDIRRNDGKQLLKAVENQASTLQNEGKKFAVITIGKDTDLTGIEEGLLEVINKTNAQMEEKQNKDGGKRPYSALLKVDNKGRDASILGLFDLGLRLGFDLGEESILECLKRIAVDAISGFNFNDITAIIRDIITKGYLYLRPIVRIDPKELDDARKAREHALRSL